MNELAAAIARYHAGCLRTIGSQNVGLRDVRTAKKAAIPCDVGLLADQETVFRGGEACLRPPPPPTRVDPGAPITPEQIQELNAQTTWERLRELAAKAALEPYNKEAVYAYPLLRGFLKRANGDAIEPVLAPLFIQAVEIRVNQDGSITVTLQDEPLRFNTALWRGSFSSGDAGQIVSFGIDTQADLAAGWDDERVAELLRGLAAVFPGMSPAQPLGVLSAWPERETPTRAKTEEPALELFEGAALFLSNRASPFLLHDLEEIADDPEWLIAPDSPLSVLLSPPSKEPGPALVSPSIEQVVFPFPSNSAQRQVADALDKNEVVVVQGPPGTGKSLTIANLAAHLVSQGKSVLVTSHKQQALKVVRDKLANTDLRFLYASLIGEGTAAKRELQSQIANVKAFAGAASAKKLVTQLETIEERRKTNGERYAEARAQFNETATPAQIEAASLFPALEQHGRLPIDDPVLESHLHVEAAAALKRLAELAAEHQSVWLELTKSPLADLRNSEDEQDLLGRFLEQQQARLRVAKDESVAAVVRAWHPVFDEHPGQVELARTAIDTTREEFLPVFAGLASTPDGNKIFASALALADAPQLLADCENDTRRLEVAFSAAREVADARDVIDADPRRRSEVLVNRAELRSLLKRKNARRWLVAQAPGAAGVERTTLERWASFWDQWATVRTCANGLAGGLKAKLSKAFGPDQAQATIIRAQTAVRLAQAICQVRNILRPLSINASLEPAFKSADVEAVKLELERWALAVTAAEADKEGNTLKVAPELAAIASDLEEIDACIDGHRYDEAEGLVDRLRTVWTALPSLAERHRLLDGVAGRLPASVTAIEQAAANHLDPPSFLQDIESALRLQPNAHRFAQIANDKTTRELAIELQQLRAQVLDDARLLLGFRIQSRILEGFRRPSFLASLETFKKAVGSSPKRYERFEELKSSEYFDVGVMTDVFPCWIMRPEDVCRIFPLRPGVFDVVIFDEASQCNPDQALPLFARASRVAIFGDDKQLSNEDLRRSLSSAANRSLRRQSGLEPLDPTSLFDQTRNSLLGLVSASHPQVSALLNEHFRCRPELIAFSNREYYGNTLRVIRDRADDHGLGLAMLVREVVGGEEVATGKVNYAEAEALVSDLERRLNDPKYAGMSFGVLSLFREQIEHIQTQIEARIPRAKRDEHQLICSTVDGFQGDERDVILYSWRFTPFSSPSIFAFTNGVGGQQRVNVALTRARHQVIHFISAPIDRFPRGASNVTPYLQHARNPELLLGEQEQRAHREPSTEARLRVAAALRDEGFEIAEDVVACGASIDLVVSQTTTGARVAIFIDAEHHPNPFVESLGRIGSHSLLERAGWTVVRIPATEALPSPRCAIGIVSAALDGQRESLQSAGEIEDAYAVIEVERGIAEQWIGADYLSEIEIAPEDLADYHWDVPSVEARLHAGDDVFQSDFERDLYDRLAVGEDLVVVPQWPSRGKWIDLVVTDRSGRRLAIEADGGQHHETQTGELISEDIARQSLLEEAGWVFHRVRHSAFSAHPDAEVEAVFKALVTQPPNENLAERVWGEVAVVEELAGIFDASIPPVSATQRATPLDTPRRSIRRNVAPSDTWYEILLGPGSRIGPAERHVGYACARKGEFSVEEIVSATALGSSTIRNALRTLTDSGLIERTARGGRGSPARWRVQDAKEREGERRTMPSDAWYEILLGPGSRIGPTERHVGHACARKGEFPVEEIVSTTAIGPSTIRNALRTLTDSGLIERTTRGGRGSPARWCVRDGTSEKEKNADPPDNGPDSESAAMSAPARQRTQTTPPQLFATEEPERCAGLDFEDVPLGIIAMQIGILLRENGNVTADDLVPLYEKRFGVTVAKQWRKTVERFAWSAKGYRFAELDEATGIWSPGKKPPARVEALGSWTYAKILGRACELRHQQPEGDIFDALLIEVYSKRGHVPRLVMSLVGKAVNAAR
jgi:very-short-patch-repair endonuclease/predicted transcriptional regulator